MPMEVLVTGATGTIGSYVVEELAKRGTKVRGAVRATTSEGAARLARNGAVAVTFDFDCPETHAAALAGVDKVFLLTALVPNQVEHTRMLVEAAKGAGTRHIVKLSGLGAGPNAGIRIARWHTEAEHLVEASGIAWTFVRPNCYMQNFLSYYPPDPNGMIYLPWGSGAVSFVDARDAAAVAAAALAEEGSEGKALEVTGPEALTAGQVAGIIGEASGRQVAYVDVPEAATRGAMIESGMPESLADAMLEMHWVCKAGHAAAVTPTVRKVLGREPRSFAQFAADHVAAWKQTN